MGTGTFLLSVIQRIAESVREDLGEGAVPSGLRLALNRLVAFEIQLGPFAVAQLRVLAELADLGLVSAPAGELQMYVTNTLSDPWVEDTHLGHIYEPISESRRNANRIKKERPIQVVLGNPPYRENSKGMGGWIEAGDPGASRIAPFEDFLPPPEWKVGIHSRHLYNLYVYFWRWGMWKVFDHGETGSDVGIVSYICVSGFLNGPASRRCALTSESGRTPCGLSTVRPKGISRL
jgi:hypothetical protein